MSLTNHESLKLNLNKTDKYAKPGVLILTCTLVQAVQYLHFTITQSHSNASLWSLEYSITLSLKSTRISDTLWLQRTTLRNPDRLRTPFFFLFRKHTLYCYCNVFVSNLGQRDYKIELLWRSSILEGVVVAYQKHKTKKYVKFLALKVVAVA